MKHWNTEQNKQLTLQGILKRLAEQILRTQRLVLTQQLQRIEQIIQMHRPALLKQAGEATQMNRLKKQLAEARYKLLRGDHHE